MELRVSRLPWATQISSPNHPVLSAPRKQGLESSSPTSPNARQSGVFTLCEPSSFRVSRGPKSTSADAFSTGNTVKAPPPSQHSFLGLSLTRVDDCHRPQERPCSSLHSSSPRGTTTRLSVQTPLLQSSLATSHRDDFLPLPNGFSPPCHSSVTLLLAFFHKVKQPVLTTLGKT